MKAIVIIDPLLKHGEWTQKQIIEMLGLVPNWAAEGLVNDADGGMKETLINNYPYYGGAMTGGTIEEDGTYHYPEDPPLYPLVSMRGKNETFFMYEYGMVAVRTDAGNHWMARFD